MFRRLDDAYNYFLGSPLCKSCSCVRILSYDRIAGTAIYVVFPCLAPPQFNPLAFGQVER